MGNRSRYAGDPVIGPLLAGYHARLAEQVKAIESLRRENNVEGLRTILHQLKGSGKSYGYDAISSLAAIGEQELAMTESMRAAGEAVEGLLGYIRGIENFPEIRS